MPQITPFMQSVLDSIDEISTKLDQNIFIKNARTAFKENISQFEIADDEKAKLTANYEAQVSIATISEIIRLAKETPLNEAQIANLQKDADIKISQKNLIDEQIKSEKAQELNLRIQTLLLFFRYYFLCSSHSFYNLNNLTYFLLYIHDILIFLLFF